MSGLIAGICRRISFFALLILVVLPGCKVCDSLCVKVDPSSLDTKMDKLETAVNITPIAFYRVKRGDTAWKLIEEYTILPPSGWGMIFVTPDLEIGEIVEFPIYYLKGGTVLEVRALSQCIKQKNEKGLAFFISSEYTPLSPEERKPVVERVKTMIFRTEIFKNDHRRTPKDAFYKVKKGDTAWELTKKYTTLPSDKWEQVFASSSLKVGQIIRFPLHYLKGETVLEIWREPGIKWETVEENGELSLKEWILLDIYFFIV